MRCTLLSYSTGTRHHSDKSAAGAGECGALSCLIQRGRDTILIRVPLEGLEPPTLSLGRNCSSGLSGRADQINLELLLADDRGSSASKSLIFSLPVASPSATFEVGHGSSVFRER